MVAGLRWSNTVAGLSSTFGLGSSLCFFPDVTRNPFAIGVGVVIASSNVTFNVEHSYDFAGSSAFTASAATWFSSFISAATSNVSATFSSPVSALRLNVTSGSSTGTATLTAIQAGDI